MFFSPARQILPFANVLHCCGRTTQKEFPMQPYRNLAGNSGVSAFEILSDGIRVRFANGTTYLYDYETPGRVHVEAMKRHARAGRGLSSYISQSHVPYADKSDD